MHRALARGHYRSRFNAEQTSSKKKFFLNKIHKNDLFQNQIIFFFKFSNIILLTNFLTGLNKLLADHPNELWLGALRTRSVFNVVGCGFAAQWTSF